MSAAEVVAEALAKATGVWPTEAAVEAVVAAIRAMRPSEFAQLVPKGCGVWRPMTEAEERADADWYEVQP